MNSLGIFNVVAGLLQLTVPSYALRLVHRFGAQRVGWFIVTAFVSLGLLHLLQPGKTILGGLTSGHMGNMVFAIASGLLVLGMSHLETLLSERVQLKREESRILAEVESKVAKRTAELTEINRELAEELSRVQLKERALRDSETQYRFLFGDNPLPMWLFDLRSLRFLAVNQAALRHYGMDHQEFMGLSALDLLPPDSIAAFQQDVAKPCIRPQSRGVWQHCRKDLSTIEVEISAVDLKFGGCPARLVVAHDVTERHRQETELLRRQEVETIGRLAGGFAHHFNNILTIIDGQANLLLRNAPDSKTAEQLTQITTAANRAAALTRQLVATGGRQSVRPEPIDINAVIQNHSPTLKRLVGDRISIQKLLGANLPAILAENRIVEHTLVHLVLNAREAIRGTGKIEIQTSLVRLSPTQAKRNSEAKPGDYVRLFVRDNGCGIAPEIQARIFEPFFTTHDIGKGTGLGLPSIYGAIKQLSGWVEFKSELGVGTEFSVFFPSSAASASVLQRESHAKIQQTHGTVFLLEPEDRARGVARYILNRQGYHVVEADCAQTAEVLWEGQAAKIDLVITDINLPGVPAPDLMERFRQIRPDLQVVYTTNVNPEVEVSGNSIPKALNLLTKPYGPDKLIEAVKAAWPKTSERKVVGQEKVVQA